MSAGAGEALQAAALAALKGIEGLGVHDGPPVQAAFPYALADAGFEADWSHKSGSGRELRLAVTIRDKGERPVRLRRLMGEAEAAIAAVARSLEGWRLISLQFLRSRLVPDGRAIGGAPAADWAGLVEFRARMLAEEE